MEELILAQVRGILVLAEYHKGNERLYIYYLCRARNALALIEDLRILQKMPPSNYRAA